MSSVSTLTALHVWEKAKSIPGYDSDVWRKDFAGAWIRKDSYGLKTEYGWEIDHLRPLSKGGDNNVDNLIALHWKNNKTKGADYPIFKTSITFDGNRNIEKNKKWKNLVEITENTLTIESQKLKENYSKHIKLGLIIFILIIFVVLIFFLHQFPYFELDYPIASERWGQFGDFIGGVIGTIITLISIILLYNAFIEQRLANIEIHESNEEIKKQSLQTTKFNQQQLFDSNFNTLLELYRNIISNYKSPSESISNGKASMSNLVSSFILSTPVENNEGYTKRTKKALNKFNDFFAKNMTIVNAHMRILYQMFNLLETDDIEKNYKTRYTKLLRSQMTDEELILIRYNCMTERGRKMQLPIFHYNILKHIPLLGLFEFKKYSRGLSNSQINSLNDEFIIWKKEICELFRRQSTSTKKLTRDYQERYSIEFIVSENNKHYTFILTKKPKTTGPKEMMVKIFDKYDDSLLENLLVDFHTEVFLHSHFKKYNRHASYKLSHSLVIDNLDRIFKIQIRQDNPLIISYYQIEHPIHE